MKFLNNKFKLMFDYSFSIILIFLFIIPIFILAIIIKLFDGSPVFFIQERAGLNGKKINIVKFKTLITLNDGGKKVSKLGKFLRLTRIDEIPQLFNVISGNLSFVGPRPLYIKYIKLYSPK